MKVKRLKLEAAMALVKTTLIRMILASGKSFDGGPVLYSGEILPLTAGSNWRLRARKLTSDICLIR